MLLKNGNTFYLHYGGKKGLEVIVFGKNKKVTAKRTIESANWTSGKKKRLQIAACFEINGEPVIFAKDFSSGAPTLYRMRLNPTTGMLVKDEKLGNVKRKAHLRYTEQLGEAQNIFVEKDAGSGNYAVIYFNKINRDRDERISVMHFGENHQVISNATYECPDPDFKIINYIGALVDGGKRVYISTYGSESRKGANAHVFIARLNAGDSAFLNKALDFTEDFRETYSDMAFDHSSNTILMLTNTNAGSSKGFLSDKTKTHYASFLSSVDPETLELKSVKQVTSELVNRYAHTALGLDDYYYSGLPQRLILNADNSVAVLMEQMTTIVMRHSRHGETNGQVVGVMTNLGNVGISELKPDGSEKSGYLIAKNQYCIGRVNAFYMAGRDKGAWENNYFARNNASDNSFMSYSYLHGNKASYVLFNDDPKNKNKDESQTRRKKTLSTDFVNTICYTIKDGTAKKSYLFGEPESKKGSRACYIEGADYDAATNTYTTVVSEQHGHKYDSRIAWIHFE